MKQLNPPARLLLVEDEAVIAMDVEARLVDLGYEVCAVASTAEQAIALAGVHRPQLVIMDIRLSGSVDGVEAAAQIGELVGIPHIYLTSYTDRATLTRAKRTEPLGYLVKPFTAEDLNTTIQIALYRHRTQRRIAERREWRDSLFRQLSDAVVSLDEAGRIRSLNAPAEKLTGITQADAIGKPLASIWPRTGATKAAGDQRYLDSTLTVVGDLTGHAHQYSQNLASARSECIARLAARISHSLTEQLTVLAGGQPEAMPTMQALHSLASELSLLAHPHAPMRQLVEVDDLVEECTGSLIRPALSQHIEVDLECGATGSVAVVDRNQIQQAILCLTLTMTESPTPLQIVCIRTRYLTTLACGAPDRQIAISIAGTTSDAVHGAIDCPWQSIDPNLPATLEQKSAENLIRENGGAVQRMRSAHSGLAFRILLPQAKTVPVHRGDFRQVSSRMGERYAMVVDDAAEVRTVIRIVLEAAGFQVLEAHSAEEAISALSHSGTAISLLVTDVVLPCLNGSDLACRLRKDDPSLAVVLTSGYTEAQLAPVAARVQGAVFLPKPFTPRQLAQLLPGSQASHKSL